MGDGRICEGYPFELEGWFSGQRVEEGLTSGAYFVCFGQCGK